MITALCWLGHPMWVWPPFGLVNQWSSVGSHMVLDQLPRVHTVMCVCVCVWMRGQDLMGLVDQNTCRCTFWLGEKVGQFEMWYDLHCLNLVFPLPICTLLFHVASSFLLVYLYFIVHQRMWMYTGVFYWFQMVILILYWISIWQWSSIWMKRQKTYYSGALISLDSWIRNWNLSKLNKLTKKHI